MSRVIFLCGPAGSGKSTLARRFEADGMVRLSVDAEAWARGHRTMPLPEAAGAEIVAELEQRLLAFVRAGQDVVLDLSFWSREMRDRWRELLLPTGVVPEIVQAVASRETVLARLEARAAEHSDDFRLPRELAELYFDHFEPPTEEEGPLTVVRTD
ncbi:aminoglycoside phosphotransferase [Brachybacterium ginsengisoli]|uniref:Aminoglycoside phosphotransferase n=1 Tax=Brachybacterium ginsengisoli TaxID=1331682 RepID=A0A291H095_9MICO|nr:ATP-binding protein [Brachybacterium ginsengisoli]ATG55776.1 aminoglycoside phosphotransferase [Brachybacterium ginsengisoli]